MYVTGHFLPETEDCAIGQGLLFLHHAEKKCKEVEKNADNAQVWALILVFRFWDELI